MDKALIAQTVANKLFATEDAVDTAIVEASKLLGGLVEARHEMRLSAVVGDDVVVKVAAALTALAEARKAVVEAHNELAEVKLRVGIRAKLLGVVDKTQGAVQHEPMIGHRRAS
jgi:hypothetical protein